MTHLCKANLGGNVTQQSKIHKISKRFWHALTISILMGLTWVSGLLAIEDAKFIFSVIFCVCNSLQGVAIFLLFCVRQEDVRKTVLASCYCTKASDSSSGQQTHSTGLPRTHTQFSTRVNSGDFMTVIPTTEHNIGHARGGSYTNFSGGVAEYELYAVDNHNPAGSDHHDNEPETDPASPLLIEQTKTSSMHKSSSTSSKTSSKF